MCVSTQQKIERVMGTGGQPGRDACPVLPPIQQEQACDVDRHQAEDLWRKSHSQAEVLKQTDHLSQQRPGGRIESARHGGKTSQGNGLSTSFYLGGAHFSTVNVPLVQLRKYCH
jgi:hypothetical protein